MASYPCTDDPKDILDAIEGVKDAEAAFEAAMAAAAEAASSNADKFDKFVNGTSLEEVQLGVGEPTPTLRNLCHLVKSAAAELDNSDVSGKFSDAANGGETLRMLADRFGDVLNVKDFGAVGDGATDDTAAIQAAVDFALTASNPGGTVGKAIWFPDGKYLVTEPISAWRLRPKTDGTEPNLTRIDLTFAGSSQWSSQILAGFSGDASQSVIDCTRPAGTAANRRCCPTSFRDLGFAMADPEAAACPVYINVYGWGESRMDHVRMGQSDNTHVRGADLQNIRAVDVVSFYGGKAWKYKDSLQETITLDSASILATSSNAFSNEDVGKKVFLTSNESSKTNGFFTIASLDSGKKVAIQETGYSMEASRLTWEPARCDIEAGSAEWTAVLTADAACFAASDVGRVILIRGARVGLYGSGFLRASIVAVASASQVTVDYSQMVKTTDANPADPFQAVSNAMFAQPVFDFYAPPDLSSGSSDVSFFNLHVEHYRGLGFGCLNGTGWRVEGKLHGETAYYEDPSSAAMWLDDYDGVNNVILDSSCAMTGTRVVVSNNNGTAYFSNLQTRHSRNERIIHQGLLNTTYVETWGTFGGGGATVVDNCLVLSRSSSLDVLFHDENASIPRLFVRGVVSFSGSPKPFNYLSKNAYFDMDNGLIVDGKISGSLLTTTGGVISLGEILASKSTLACSSQNGTFKASIGCTNGAVATLDVGSSARVLCSSPTSLYSGVTSGSCNLGAASALWKEVFASEGAINTSDARMKTSIGDPDDALMRAWGKVRFRVFQKVDAVQEKGDAARLHVGVVAQQIAEAFASEGLDASRYGLFCYDEWEDQYEDMEVVDSEAVYASDGKLLSPAQTHMEHRLVTPAGDAYGIRYAEALALECAYQRWKLEQIEARLALMEG